MAVEEVAAELFLRLRCCTAMRGHLFVIFLYPRPPFQFHWAEFPSFLVDTDRNWISTAFDRFEKVYNVSKRDLRTYLRAEFIDHR